MSDKAARSRLCAREAHKRLRLECKHRNSLSEQLEEALPIASVLRKYQKDPSSFTPAMKKVLNKLAPPTMRPPRAMSRTQQQRQRPNAGSIPASPNKFPALHQSALATRTSRRGVLRSTLPEVDFILTPTSLYESNEQYVRSLKSSGLYEYLHHQQLKLTYGWTRDKHLLR